MSLAMLQVGQRIMTLVRSAVEHYAVITAMGGKVDEESLASFIEKEAGDWDPVIKGRRLLRNPDTRKAGARFLAGIAYEVALGEQAEKQGVAV